MLFHQTQNGPEPKSERFKTYTLQREAVGGGETEMFASLSAQLADPAVPAAGPLPSAEGGSGVAPRVADGCR